MIPNKSNAKIHLQTTAKNNGQDLSTSLLIGYTTGVFSTHTCIETYTYIGINLIYSHFPPLFQSIP